MTRRDTFATGLTLLLTVGAGADAATGGESPRRVRLEDTDLAGRWLLTMPAGFEYDATLQREDEPGRYRLRCRATNLSGVYEFQGRCLTAVSPDNERMTGLGWELKNRNVLLLTVHPESAAVGSDYRNATLSRQKSADERPRRRTIPDERGRTPLGSPRD